MSQQDKRMRKSFVSSSHPSRRRRSRVLEESDHNLQNSTVGTRRSIEDTLEPGEKEAPTMTKKTRKYESQSTSTHFKRGDHVYQWCSFAGLPNVYQHHGIVMHVERIPGSEEERLTIADFSNFLPSSPKRDSPPGEDQAQATIKDSKDIKGRVVVDQLSGSMVGDGAEATGGVFRVYTTSSKISTWHKVEYGATRWKTIFSRSGICTTVEASDPPEVVLNRVNFLLMQSERDVTNDTFVSTVLPKYDLFFANCECVACWCKTGRWTTLQGAAILAGAAYGGSSVAIGQATTTAAGAAGMAIGSTAEAAALSDGMMAVFSAGPNLLRAASTQPAMAAMAAAGALAVGGSAATLMLVQSKWNATTKELNEALQREMADSITKPVS